jgi:hypothetical protein
VLKSSLNGDSLQTELSQVKVTLRLTISQSLSHGVEPHLGLMTRYLLLFDNYGLVFCGAPSLTRRRICPLYMLLALASAIFLGSESFGTRDHIILSQIWDFPFRRLLRLAGSWWRYSTLPPHGLLLTELRVTSNRVLVIISRLGLTENTVLLLLLE